MKKKEFEEGMNHKNFNELVQRWIDEACNRIENENEEQIRERYEPDGIYHMLTDGVTKCGINTKSNSCKGEPGKWKIDHKVQALLKPCPECVKKSVEEDKNPWEL